MRPPRVRLRTMMVVVAVVAVMIAEVLAVRGLNFWELNLLFLVVIGFPTQLMVVLMILATWKGLCQSRKD